ncbi:MAG: DNA polymerase/3'-5' exonuclease PolX [Calditrichaeota bacterium]|nr:DNA polymerase/3'-5' exonuclease PolX [Calditrichota bacterium]
MRNDQIALRFDELAELTELKGGDQFRARAYRNTARSLRTLDRSVAEMAAAGENLTELPEIGKSNAHKIVEIIDTGTCEKLEKLRELVPPGLVEVLRIPGVGPATARRLHAELAVHDLASLREQSENGRLAELKGLGEAVQEKILAGLDTVEKMSGRRLLHEIGRDAGAIAELLAGLDSVREWELAGSYRRRLETIGDIDVVLRSSDRDRTVSMLERFDEAADVLGGGREKVSLRLHSGLRVDFQFAGDDDYGAALLYLTGSKAHGIALRKRAQEHGWTLNEHGLFSGDNRLAANSERAVYGKLGLAWIPPELREHAGEIEAAERGELPDLIEPGEIRGELHAHTTASDGAESIETMARAAKRRGLDYLAITDHSQAVAVAGGLNEDELRRHAGAVRELNERLDGIELLAGVEVDILRDGRLDIDETLLMELDYVVASVHSSMNQSRERTTKRYLSAIESGVVHSLGHLFGRKIGEREGMELDADRVFAACAEHGVCIEINGQPDRLDLPADYCRRAQQAGVKFTLGSDAHSLKSLEFLEYCVWVARRGWLTRDDVLNTLSADALRARLAGIRNQPGRSESVSPVRARPRGR